MDKLIGLFYGALVAFTAFLGRKVATVGASLTAFVFLTAAMIICLKALFSAVIAVLVIPAWLLTPIGLFMPSLFVTFLAILSSGIACRTAYDYAIQKIKLVNSAS